MVEQTPPVAGVATAMDVRRMAKIYDDHDACLPEHCDAAWLLKLFATQRAALAERDRLLADTTEALQWFLDRIVVYGEQKRDTVLLCHQSGDPDRFAVVRNAIDGLLEEVKNA